VFRNKPNRDDKLLVAFDARVLSEVVSREVGLAKIVHGENYATLKVKTFGEWCTQIFLRSGETDVGTFAASQLN
jgi:hypothetical protein